MWKVYKISFQDDGGEYVGITSRDEVDYRLYQHYCSNKYSNLELQNRLSHGDSYSIQVLSKHRLESCARTKERKEIQKLQKPINIVYATKPQYTKYKHLSEKPKVVNYRSGANYGYKRPARCNKPVPGCYICSLCRKKKASTHFHKDRTRFNGLHSRCKKCVSYMRKKISEARKNNISPSAAYYKAKERLKPIKQEELR